MSSPAVASPVPLEVPAPRPRTNVSTNADSISIPAWVCDFESFRRWAISDEFPEQGRIEYINGDLWVDLSMEDLYAHNQVKAAFNVTILVILEAVSLGRFVLDRMRLSHPGAGLSVEPDGLFFTWETLKSGRLREVQGKKGGFIELEGTPDMALEIVSDSSVEKDTRLLRQLYWRAGIREYWLADARRFDILRYTSRGYRKTEAVDGWMRSQVFGRSFRLTQSSDPVGRPLYRVEARED